MTTVKDALDMEIAQQTDIKMKVLGALQTLKHEQLKASCYGCQNDRPSQSDHIGGCMTHDDVNNPLIVGAFDILMNVDEDKLASNLDLSIDQVQQCLVEIWSNPTMI
jgi:hypothetical protein